jgi:hypothetical protein
MTDEEWIEMFYSDLERGLEGKYTRPVDYKERAKRVLNGELRRVKGRISTDTKGNINEL